MSNLSNPPNSTPNERRPPDEAEQDIKAYEHLWQRHTFEDRLLLDRTSMLLLSNSFLFVGFVALLSFLRYEGEPWLRFIVPIIGVFLAFLTFQFTVTGNRVLTLIECQEKQMEDKNQPYFKVMTKLRCRLDSDRKQWPYWGKLGFSVALPIAIGTLWMALLVWLSRAYYPGWFTFTLVITAAAWSVWTVLALVGPTVRESKTCSSS